MSSDGKVASVSSSELLSQSLWNRAMSSDKCKLSKEYEEDTSQSLWNRAMSSDEDAEAYIDNVLSQSLWNRAMSSDINFLQLHYLRGESLNPFGTGQCLPTN